MNIQKFVVKHGDVWLQHINNEKVISENHICDGTESLAIAVVGDLIIKRGSERSVKVWCEKNKDALELQQNMFDDKLDVFILPVHEASLEIMNWLFDRSVPKDVLVKKLEEATKKLQT